MTGRFLTKDPFPGFKTQPISLHPYQYAYNNPLRYSDPSGENPLCLALVAADGPAPFGDATCIILLAYTFYAGVVIAQNVDIPANFTPPFPSSPPRYDPLPPFDLGPCPDPAYIPGPTLGNIGPHVFDYPLNEEAGIWWTEGGTTRLDIPTYLTAKGGTPRGNQAQNKQFKGAVREIERTIGRRLSKKEIRRLHDEISGMNFGYHEIVEEGIGLFEYK